MDAGSQASTLNINEPWSQVIWRHMRAHPLTATSLALALAVVLLLLLQSIIMILSGNISPGTRYGILGGLAVRPLRSEHYRRSYYVRSPNALKMPC